MSADMSEDEGGPLSAQDWHNGDVPGSPADSAKSDIDMDEKPSAGGTSSQPQKRRRVTRACDECRRKKIKCDGKQPCTHCSVYSYECTYDKPSNRRRNPAPQYIEALEDRLRRAETLLRKFVPDVNLADPNLDPTIQQEFANRERVRVIPKPQANGGPPDSPQQNDLKLVSMINALGQLDVDSKDGCEYHGSSSGAVYLTKMRDHFQGLLDADRKDPFLPRPDLPTSAVDFDISSNMDFPKLPPKDVARKLCYYSLNCATCLIRVVHIPSFYEKVEKVYSKPLDSMGVDERRFLGLLYAILSLGCMYVGLDDASLGQRAYQEAIKEGLKYFKASRALMQDITQCKDLTSLQALIFMILFLQATSNLTTCYTFIGIALRTAMRMGLHRNIRHDGLNPLEREERSRIFYAIRQMDIYVSTLLGYPLLLSKDDVDQVYPTELDDEHITVRGIVNPAPGASSFFQAFNAHTRLMEILVKINKYVYPVGGSDAGMRAGDLGHAAYRVSHGRIKEIEADLQQWFEKLPGSWRPSPDGPVEVVRVRHLLRFAYAHVQLVLYRPFLHYVSPQLKQGTKTDEISYACAAAAISVSRNIVHIGLEIRKQSVLSGPYWFMLHTELFAVLSLVFYALENPDKPGSQEVLQDARAGRQMIEDLAAKSQSADRISKSLTNMFDQLPESLDHFRKRSVSTKKQRPHPSRFGSSSSSASMPQGMPSARAPTQSRSRTSNLVASILGRSKSSTNAAPPPEQTYQGNSNFTNGMPDYMVMDMSRTTPDSAGTGDSTPLGFSSQLLEPQNMMHKVDSFMFSPEDPFQYPNQPIMDLPFKTEGDQMATGDFAPVPQFFMAGAMDDVSQMLGQPPPYNMMQNQMLPMNPGMYDPQTMMSMHMGGQQAFQGQPQMQHPGMAPRRAHVVKSQERQIDQMFTSQGMQPDWGSFFGSGRGGFQGM